MRRRADKSQRVDRVGVGHRLNPLIENEPDVDGLTSPGVGDPWIHARRPCEAVRTQYVQGNAATEDGWLVAIAGHRWKEAA